MDRSEAVSRDYDTPKAISDTPSLGQVLSELNSMHHQLEDRLAKLVDRLEPVLRSPHPTEARAGFDSNPALSPLGNDLLFQLQHTRQLIDRVDDMSVRLQL